MVTAVTGISAKKVEQRFQSFGHTWKQELITRWSTPYTIQCTVAKTQKRTPRARPWHGRPLSLLFLGLFIGIRDSDNGWEKTAEGMETLASELDGNKEMSALCYAKKGEAMLVGPVNGNVRVCVLTLSLSLSHTHTHSLSLSSSVSSRYVRVSLFPSISRHSSDINVHHLFCFRRLSLFFISASGSSARSEEYLSA